MMILSFVNKFLDYTSFYKGSLCVAEWVKLGVVDI